MLDLALLSISHNQSVPGYILFVKSLFAFTKCTYKVVKTLTFLGGKVGKEEENLQWLNGRRNDGPCSFTRAYIGQWNKP